MKKKRLTSLLLTLAMVLTMIPVFGVTAGAASPLPDFKADTNGVISWSHAENADAYAIDGLIPLTWIMIQENNSSESMAKSSDWEETGVTLHLREYLDLTERCLPGTYNLKIIAFRNGNPLDYESSFSFVYESKLTKMQKPENLKWHGTTASWDPVPGATEYHVFLDEKDSTLFGETVKTSSFSFDPSMITYSDSVLYHFAVRANADGYVESETSISEEVSGAELLNGYDSTVGKSPTHTVNVNSLNVREGPGSEYARIGGLTKEKKVTVVDTQGEWSKIPYGTGYGWVQRNYLKEIEKPAKITNPFVDIYESDDYYNAVLWAYYASPQITNGMDATHFGPHLTVTRGQAVTFLWRAMGCPEPSGLTNPFVDVSSTEYYYKPVLWAVENGITRGVDETHFNPMDTLSTQHMITFMYRTAFPGMDGWDGEAAAWAADENGRPFGVDIAVNNTTPCPRCHVVQFLYD